MVNHISYPMDYANGTTFLDNMKTGNLLAYPVEKILYREVGSDRFLLGGQITKYKTGGKGEIDELLQMNINTAVSLSQFKYSNRASTGAPPTSGRAATFSPDARYELETKYDSYDSYGNLLQYTGRNGLPNSFLWGYSGLYPTAKVASANNLETAHTSFETNGESGNWVYNSPPVVVDQSSPTGRRAFTLSSRNTLSKGGLTPSRQYVISYWRKGGSPSSVGIPGTQSTVTGNTVNGWTFEEKTISGIGTATLSGSIRVDEVRLYPEGSQMNTYTYDPLVGLTGKTDVRNYTIHYEYDGIGRLRTIKDQEGNILKHYEYNFIGN